MGVVVLLQGGVAEEEDLVQEEVRKQLLSLSLSLFLSLSLSLSFSFSLSLSLSLFLFLSIFLSHTPLGVKFKYFLTPPPPPPPSQVEDLEVEDRKQSYDIVCLYIPIFFLLVYSTMYILYIINTVHRLV